MKVELVSHTPNPIELCARAAGVSYAKEEKENPSAFIKRVVAMGHESVLEHASFTFRVEGISRACSHQWVRHRICSFTQRSQRHVDESEAEFVYPPLDYLSPDKRTEANNLIRKAIENALESYKVLKKLGVRLEDARYVLPNATQTVIYWTVNARELRHFFKLRLAKDAQWEIKELARRIFDLVYPIAPEFFEDLKPLHESAKLELCQEPTETRK